MGERICVRMLLRMCGLRVRVRVRVRLRLFVRLRVHGPVHRRKGQHVRLHLHVCVCVCAGTPICRRVCILHDVRLSVRAFTCAQSYVCSCEWR